MSTISNDDDAALPPEIKTAQPEAGMPESAVRLVCNVAEAYAIRPSSNLPPLPIVAAFGSESLHQCRLEGEWDLDRAIAANPARVTRSYRNIMPENEWEDIIFQFGPRAFLCADQKRVVGYASTPQEAENLVREFSEIYTHSSVAAGGSFQLIKQDEYEISCEPVTLKPDSVLSDAAFALHYCFGTAEWHCDFTSKLGANEHGLTILEGAPGTGKTSYLRHLMGTLKESHRFYFIPTSTMGILSKSEFIGFWADQRRMHSKRRFVVILEDSDAALMTRDSDNREQVSAILNLSDGMLADFLRLQIICTINCNASDIDQALLRPGRLLSHRVFKKLNFGEAARLAASLGRTLPVVRDYTLAEVFAGSEADDVTRPRIGFAA